MAQRSIQLRDLGTASGDLFVEIVGAEETDIPSLAYDTHRITPGGLFFCIPGTVRDGHEFAADAVARGAAALCVQRRLKVDVPQLVVTDTRRFMGRAAAEYYGRPAERLTVLGITGTNGKTTTTYLVEAILAAAGHKTGLIGTIATRVGNDSRPGVRTTPESLDLQALFADMVEAGVTAVAMEVTSHALVLHRVEAVKFAAAAFTNLSQDHLDFHSDMEDYFAAKRELFTTERTRAGATNVDDPYGRKLLAASIPMLGFGGSPDAELRADQVDLGATSTEFVIEGRDLEIKVTTPLIGAFNVCNCLAAAAVCLQAGIDAASVQAGLEVVTSVPGRFESIDEGQPFSVVVDYAHTPDSLDNVLRAARRLVQGRGGRVICAFGAGGDRDQAKRPLMGAAVARWADIVVVTSDNPRSEDPHIIIDSILEGVVAEREGGADIVEADRRVAIGESIDRARPDDIVVIAGKGHETGQEFADRTIPFDDREVAREFLRMRGAKR